MPASSSPCDGPHPPGVAIQAPSPKSQLTASFDGDLPEPPPAAMLIAEPPLRSGMSDARSGPSEPLSQHTSEAPSVMSDPSSLHDPAVSDLLLKPLQYAPPELYSNRTVCARVRAYVCVCTAPTYR